MSPRTVGSIRTRAAFGQLQRSRARATSGPVRAAFVPAPADQPGLFPQVGYAIGRNCGNAVTRNALRRRMRAIVQSSAGSLPRGTYLLRAEATATEVPPADLAGHVRAALAQAAASGPRS